MIRPVLLQQTVDEFDAEASFCAAHGLELESAPDYGWVIRVASTNHQGLVLGSVDELKDCVELMHLDGDFHWTSFDSLHEALKDVILHRSRERGPEQKQIDQVS